MKQNQTLFHGTYSNLRSFFIRCKILKYQMLKEIGHIQQRKILHQEPKSPQYSGHHENIFIVVSKKDLKIISVALRSKIILNNFVQKNIDIQQAVFFYFLKNQAITQKSHICEEGGAHFRISVWHLLMNLKKNYQKNC